MASEWEMAMGVEPPLPLGMGMGTSSYTYHHHNASSISHHSGGGASYDSTAAHHHNSYYGMPPPPAVMGDLSTGAGAHDFFPTAAAAAHSGPMAMLCGEPSPTANSSDHHLQTASSLSFADQFYIPSEEAAELEWLSKFVDDSYSDMPPANYPSAAAHAAAMAAAAAAAANTAATTNGGGRTSTTSSGHQNSRVTAAPSGRGARGKRSSRATATTAAGAWHSSLVPGPPPSHSPSPSSSSSPCSSSSELTARPSGRGGGGRNNNNEEAAEGGGGVRRCTHCASEKTPQWRTGPLGPKTLCNACGVRFKSGRLVPEYRPAASPTFVLTQHSNSHRKVMELRQQKEHGLIRGGTHRDRDVAVSAAAAAAAGGAGSAGLVFRDYGVY